MTQVCIFEDKLTLQFNPLIETSAVYQLRAGICSLLDKIMLTLKTKNQIVLHSRKKLSIVTGTELCMKVNEIEEDDTIFINGRIIANDSLKTAFKILEAVSAGVIEENGEILLARMPAEELSKFKLPELFTGKEFNKLKVVGSDLGLKTAGYFWELINISGEEIVADIRRLKLKQPFFKARKVKVTGKKGVFIGQNVDFGEGVILDTFKGPIYFEGDNTIGHNAVIVGPAYIGRGTVIKMSAKIYENCSIGPVCKIGGELEAVTIMGFSNKQHEGFLGHSYLGEWINLGAGTENSDLKNNYSNVKVVINGKEVDSQLMFVGCCIGDHTRTGIKTMINTGSVFGVFCNIFGSGYQPKYIENFSWHDNDKLKKSSRYKKDKAISTAKIVMERRAVELSNERKALYQSI